MLNFCSVYLSMTTYKEKVRSTELANKAKLAEVNVFFIVVLVSAINARGKNVFFAQFAS